MNMQTHSKEQPQRQGVKAIVLNEEQSKRFLSFFITEAFQIVKKRETESKAQAN